MENKEHEIGEKMRGRKEELNGTKEKLSYFPYQKLINDERLMSHVKMTSPDVLYVCVLEAVKCLEVLLE